jgi:hypothetical protein
MPITALPTPPSRQDPTNFNDRADAFLGALPQFQSEANALQTNVNTSEVNAVASAAAVLAATNIVKWVSGTTYANGAVVWSPINGLGYRRITTSGSGTTDPSLDTTNYKQVNGTGDVSTSGNQTIAGTKTFTSNIAGSITGNAETVTNGVYTTGNQTIAGEKTFSNTLYLADTGVMFNSDGGKDTGFSWSSDGVMNVRSNGTTVGQFNTSGFTGNAGSVTNGVYNNGGTYGINITGNSNSVSNLNTSQVLNATAGASVGAVGTYAFIREINTTTTRNPGDTLAASNLRYTNSSSVIATSPLPAGTWRCMGYGWTQAVDNGYGSFTYFNSPTLWLRIS